MKEVYYGGSDTLKLRYARRRFNNRALNTSPLVSIIIATYNRSEILINRTLPSVLAQTYTNIEVIIVGDNCIDDTPKLLNNYPDSRVHFYDLKKRGKYPKNPADRWFVQGAKPRNKAMNLANGDWFVFISDDDVMYPHHVQTLLSEVQNKGYEFISAAYETIKNGKKVVVNPTIFNGDPDFIIGGMQTWLYRAYLSGFKWNIDAWRKTWNRPIDYDLQVRFFKAGVSMTHINSIVYLNPAVKGTQSTGYVGYLESIENNRR